jgi:flagellar assembly protein FliH
MSTFQPIDLAQITGEAPREQFSAAPGEEAYLPPLQPSSADLSDPAELGYQEGIRSGLQQVEEQTRALLLSLGAATGSWNGEKQAALRELENQAALLAYQLAGALVDAQLSTTPELVQGIVKGALGEVSEADSVTLFIHPDDLALLDEQLLQVAGQHLVLRADPGITRGGCRVESQVGDIDATREGRQEYLREKISEIISERRA